MKWNRSSTNLVTDLGISLIALLVLLHVPPSAPAQEVDQDQTSSPRIAYGFETDFNPRYVYRGIAFSQGPVNQSTAWVTVSGLTIYAWGNLVLDREPHQRKLNEIDFGASYTYEWKNLSLEPAFDYFAYRSQAPLQDPPTGEASLKVSRPVGPVNVFTKQTFDIGSHRGAYFGEAGLSYERKLDRKTTLRTVFITGWASVRFNEVYIGVPRRAFNLIGSEVSLTYAPSPRFYLRPHFELTRIADRQLRRHLESPTIGNFGLAIGFNLNAAAPR